MQDNNKENIDNAVEFLTDVGFESLASSLLESDNWNNGSEMVGFNTKNGQVVDVFLDLYNFSEGENIDFTLSKSEFQTLVELVKNNNIKQEPAKKAKLEALYTKLSEKLKGF